MKRFDLERHLREQGGALIREGGNHSIWRNPAKGKLSAVPRHREINDFTARKICRDLEIAQP